MPRKLPDISTTQLIASATATAVAAFGASTLGVYGTIVGAALMSVISTAGTAIAKHYLDQGRSQLKELTHLQAAVRRREPARGAAETATSADPTRTAVWSGDPNATRNDPPGGGDPNATRFGPFAGGDPNATRMDPVETVAGSFAEQAGEGAVRQVVRRSAWTSTVEWAKAHWAKLAVTSGVVFAIVIGGITIYEAMSGQPIGGGGGKGLTVTNVLGGGGGQPEEAPSQNPSGGPTEPGATPGETPTGEAPATGPSTPERQPTGQPTGQPTQQPTQAPTAEPSTPVPTAPDTPAPTEDPGGTGQDGGPDGGQGRTAPAE